MRINVFKLIKKFLIRLGFIFLKSFSVVLIVLITIQMVTTNPDFANSMVQQYVGPYFETEVSSVTEEVKPATKTVSRNVEVLTLKLKNYSYGEGILLRVNGERITDFSEEIVNIELEADDEVVIDSRQVEEEVWIEILEKPSFVEYKGNFLWLNNQLKEIATTNTMI